MTHPRWQHFSTVLLRGCLFFLLTVTVTAQRDGHSVAFYAGFNDHGRIFPYPQSPDHAQRLYSEDLSTAWSTALSWRYHFAPSVALNVRGDFVSAIDEETDQVGSRHVRGFRFLLLESSILFSLPFSTARFDSYIGGGAGVYTGRRVYSVAGIEARHVSADPAVGIQVLIGAEYLLSDFFGLRLEVVFRDPQIGVENRFPQSSVTSGGIEYPLQTEPFRSNINLNGNAYTLGVCYLF